MNANVGINPAEQFSSLNEELTAMKSVAGFLATTMDCLSHYGGIEDLSRDNGSGLYHILRWMEARIDAASTAAETAEDRCRSELLSGMGLPLEAFSDQRSRMSWQSGYQAALSQLEAVDPAAAARLRERATGAAPNVTGE